LVAQQPELRQEAGVGSADVVTPRPRDA
jgi:hypothetical protein